MAKVEKTREGSGPSNRPGSSGNTDTNSGNAMKKLKNDNFAGKKKKKTVATFNPEKRKEFLTGFKKRKDARRAKAVEHVKREEREAKADFRKQKRDEMDQVNAQYEEIKAIQNME